ncbi:uncharacterized protein PHALS_01375 [Plasmopara halstedii]|uniref:Uncharacterized protein n=1 Tax=Plasmopara halstedii TaxID=4781 RepID=A0A0P1AWS1_PLAHL|nr:uncharacterized protein PHALS_01375 [Plasmopara halstedii]CEG45048.1 hypothetical protein PHALS_01375 [Plasmopara halstedii]|eukprot:XP_024581417.1 hypothetical protein PHALS_01375 [Plasmopara halstedii]
MGWKAVESEEYGSSSPAVQAHFHAVRAEKALRHDDYIQAEKEGHLASEKFLQAAQCVSDKRTIDALMLLAENYEYRAKVARARNPCPVKTEDTVKEHQTEDEKERTLEQQQELDVEISDPLDAQRTETQLNVAAAEIEELWRRLNEIGLTSPDSTDKNVLMSSRHLSSSLGDSFCLLPAKGRKTIGVVATAVDGGSTLRAAVASRMRNQRQRLIEQQLGSKAPVDARSLSNTLKDGNNYTSQRGQDGQTSLGSGERLGEAQRDYESLLETVSNQKLEIVRLLNSVKALSSENTKLVKECEAMTNVQAENLKIRELMEIFKKDYNQKLVMIKRALEEWRRQQNVVAQAQQTNNTAIGGNLESRIKMQEETIARLTEEAKIKDDRIAKYDKWYKTLKAGAKAKQLNRSRDSGNDTSSFSSSSAFVQYGDGTLVGSSSSFTNSSSFHNDCSEDSADSTSSTSRQYSRPPAHPNRRAL